MIRVLNANGYADIDPSVTLTATAELTSISPKVGSIYGGLEVQIAGSGFHPTATTVNVNFSAFFFNYKSIAFSGNGTELILQIEALHIGLDFFDAR